MDQTYSLHSVYIVFTSTASGMGKLIRFCTNYPYNHVSLSFDPELSVMYSFARKNRCIPLAGGFVTEFPGRYSASPNVTTAIYRILLKEEEYRRLVWLIRHFSSNKKRMVYNTLNALLSLCNKKVPIKNAYTCVEFVSNVLGYHDVITIRDLQNSLSPCLFYTGYLNDIMKENKTLEQTRDEYFLKAPPHSICVKTIDHFLVLFGHILQSLFSA